MAADVWLRSVRMAMERLELAPGAAAAPSTERLNEQLAPLAAVRFVAQLDKKLPAHEYNARIVERREVPTRAGHWHDVANALIWATFPQAKRQLHARQAVAQAARRQHGGLNRSPEEDALAMLDEGGVVLLGDERWAFGHALIEAVLVGRELVSPRGLRVGPPTDWPQRAELDRLRWLDAQLTASLNAGWPTHKDQLAMLRP